MYNSTVDFEIKTEPIDFHRHVDLHFYPGSEKLGTLIAYTVLADATDRVIVQWENVIADAYSQRLKKEEQSSMENKVENINSK